MSNVLNKIKLVSCIVLIISSLAILLSSVAMIILVKEARSEANYYLYLCIGAVVLVISIGRLVYEIKQLRSSKSKIK